MRLIGSGHGNAHILTGSWCCVKGPELRRVGLSVNMREVIECEESYECFMGGAKPGEELLNVLL